MGTGRIVKKDDAVTSGSTLPEAGRIKIGETVHGTTKEGKPYDRPTSLDYFRATGEYADMFKKTFGDKPKKLLIVFISDNIDEVCNQRFECWDKGKRWGWGDGEKFTIWDEKAGPMGKNGPTGAYREAVKGDPLLSGRKWDEMLTLRFILPEMSGLIAQWSFTTKGAKSIIPSIIKGFDFMMERCGRVAGIPWEFHVTKAKSYSPGEARQYSTVKLIPVITASIVEKLHDFLEGGGQLAKIAPIMLNEAKLEGAKRLAAPETVMEAETFQEAVEVKDEPVVEKKTEAAAEEKTEEAQHTTSIKPQKFKVDKEGNVSNASELPLD